MPEGSCTDIYSFDFFFIKQFQSIFSRIKNICISVVRVCFKNKLCFSVFLFLIFFYIGFFIGILYRIFHRNSILCWNSMFLASSIPKTSMRTSSVFSPRVEVALFWEASSIPSNCRFSLLL